MASRKVPIPNGGIVVVCDGRRALLLRNEGSLFKPDLQVQRVFEAPPNPPTREQGTDKPPRVRFAERRSSIAQTDWHDLAEQRFADEVAQAVNAIEPMEALIIVAPPRSLAELRRSLSERLRRVIVTEIDKDLVKHPVEEISRWLVEA